MAIIKPEQLSAGSYSISGSFSGSFHGDGSDLTNLPTQSFDTGSFVTTSSFNAFTGSYNTGSFTGSFIGNGSGLTNLPTQSFDTGSFVLTSSFNAFTSSIYSFTSSISSSVDSLTNATSSYVLNSQTSSMFVSSSIHADSASIAISSSYALSASYTPSSLSSSFATSASYALSSSIAQTASYYNETDPVFTAKSGSFVTTSSFNSFTGSYNTGSFTGSFTGSLLGTASYASNALSASYAANGGVTQLLAGPNVTLSPTNGLGQVTVSATLSGSTIFNTATGSYGSFYDTTTQTNVASTARSMSFNTTDISNGVSISGSTSPFNTYIKTQNAGVYDIQFSAQVDKTDSGTDEIWIWLRKNGSNLNDTATSLQLVGNGAHYVAAWNWFVNSAANDYYQIMWYSPDANVRLHAEAGFGVVPGIPSVILTANRVDQFLSNTGSFSGSFTGTLTGTASYASNSLSASYAPSTPPFPYTGSALITGSLGITGSASILAFTGSSANIFTIRNSSNTADLLYIRGNKEFALASALAGDGFSTYLSSQTGVTQLTAAGQSLALYAAYNINYNAVNQHNFMINGVVRAFMNSSGYLGIGQLTPTARLDVKAQGALSTDIAFRVRNSADTADLISFRGDGSQWIQSVPFIHAGNLTGGTNAAQSLYIGYNSSGTSSIGIRNTIIGTGTGNSANGSTQTAIGWGVSTGGFNTSIAIGAGATLFANNQCVIGSETYPFNTLQIGTGGAVTSAAAVQSMIFSVGGVAGGYTSNTDLSSKFFRIQSQGGSGTGNSAPIQFSVAPSGSAGFTANTFVIPFEVRGDAAGLNHYQLSTPRVPSASITDGYIQYSNDITAGNASPHFRTEAGNIVKLYTQAAVTSSQGIADALTNLGFLTGSSVINPTASYALTASSALEISSAITNNINNNILTATGTGTINGESNLTFNSQTLTLTNGILTLTGSTLSNINQTFGGGAQGLYSYAQGLRANANGSYSHAEGADTSAPGESSHAEGSGSATSTQLLYGARDSGITSGVFQLAGDVTTIFAPGNRLYYNSAAHPDNTSFVIDTAVFGGVNTTITLTNTAITDSNFVVGSLDYPYSSWNGNQSSVSIAGHAEGWNTNAVADYSHAEGTQTQTFARYSHAEGFNAQANGIYSHAEGRNTKTFGEYSHAEGRGTQTTGDGSHAEGYRTQATGSWSHAEGGDTIASGSRSHAEGSSTTANGSFSHAEGASTLATGEGSHAEGDHTTAYGYASHAEGTGTIAYGYVSHTEGNSTQTGITSAYIADDITAGLVKINTLYGDQTGLFTQGSSLMYGSATSLDGVNLLISGSYWDTTNTYVQLLDLSVDTATASTIVAVQNDINYNNISNNAGDQLFVGQQSHAEGVSTISTGYGSHAEGASTIATGDYSHAEGDSTTATGGGSHAEGSMATATGEYSHAEGGGTLATGEGSHAEGFLTISGILGHNPGTAITSGVFELDTQYGDISSQFTPGNFVLIQDSDGEIAGVPTVYKLEIASATYNATPATEITLVDTSINTIHVQYKVGQYETIAPVYAKAPIGDSSHAAGMQTQTYGYASNTAGFGTQALGYYQTVVGQGNIPLSDTSSFIVGNGTYDSGTSTWTRSNLLVAGSDTVQISGSLILSPTASSAPTSPGTDGQIIFGQDSGNYKIYVWLGGAWRSGSLS